MCVCGDVVCVCAGVFIIMIHGIMFLSLFI